MSSPSQSLRVCICIFMWMWVRMNKNLSATQCYSTLFFGNYLALKEISLLQDATNNCSHVYQCPIAPSEEVTSVFVRYMKHQVWNPSVRSYMVGASCLFSREAITKCYTLGKKSHRICCLIILKISCLRPRYLCG